MSYSNEDKTLYAELLASVSKDASKKLPFLLVFSANAALRKYPHDTNVFIYRRSRKIANLVNNLFEDLKGEHVWHGIKEMGASKDSDIS